MNTGDIIKWIPWWRLAKWLLKKKINRNFHILMTVYEEAQGRSVHYRLESSTGAFNITWPHLKDKVYQDLNFLAREYREYLDRLVEDLYYNKWRGIHKNYPPIRGFKRIGNNKYRVKL